jgi:hypothetical protein
MRRLIAALRCFEDTPEGAAVGMALLFTLLMVGLTVTGVK